MFPKINPIHSVRWRSRAAISWLKSYRFYSDYMGRGDLVFDIGGNVGNRAVLFHNLGAGVITLEPVGRTFNQLKERTKKYSEITALNMAASDHEGNAIINICENNSAICSMESGFVESWMNRYKGSSYENEWTGKETIHMTTLDQLIETYGLPQFVKIDVEGHELAVLNGLSRPIKALSFEYSPFRIDPAFKCLDRLEELGEYEFNYSRAESFRYGLQDFVGRQAMEDELRRLESDRIAGDVYAVEVDA